MIHHHGILNPLSLSLSASKMTSYRLPTVVSSLLDVAARNFHRVYAEVWFRRLAFSDEEPAYLVSFFSCRRILFSHFQ